MIGLKVNKMQDHLSYKLSCVIDNWFKSEESDVGYIEGNDVDATFYCTGCHVFKSINLLSKSKRNKRCISCERAREKARRLS
jgi:hypothetical protein